MSNETDLAGQAQAARDEPVASRQAHAASEPDLAGHAEAASAMFRSLGDARRLRVLRLFLEVPDTLCGCEISDVLDIPDYQVSRALSALREAGLVRDRQRVGTWVHYEATRGASPWIDAVLDLVGRVPLAPRDATRLKLRYELCEQAGCVLGTAHPSVQQAFEQGGVKELPQV